MTINSIQDQQATMAVEQKPLTVQNEIQKDVLKETIDGDAQKQMLQLLASTQPQQIVQVAKEQISKGHVDIKI